MSNDLRVSGTIEVRGNGVEVDAVGDFTINLGQPKRSAELGSNLKVHGYNEAPQVPRGSGKIRDANTLNVKDDILNMTDSSITIKVANNKIYSFNHAWYSGDGDITTGDGSIQFEWEAIDADEA